MIKAVYKNSANLPVGSYIGLITILGYLEIPELKYTKKIRGDYFQPKTVQVIIDEKTMTIM